jgi:hypothetical protein
MQNESAEGRLSFFAFILHSAFIILHSQKKAPGTFMPEALGL